VQPRGCPAHYDPAEELYTIRCTVQSVHQIRAALAGQIFRLPHHQVRVVCGNMGGGLDMKGGCYLEYQWRASSGAYYSSDSPTSGMGCLVNTYTFEAV
jgi:CO/xanthine dehydrogenase Mo-binding subunit